MSNHFDSVIKKYITEADAYTPLTTSTEKNAATALNQAPPALKDAASVITKTLTPNKPFDQMSPVEQLQAVVDPKHPVNDITKVNLTPELTDHLKKIGMTIGKTNSSQEPTTSSENQTGGTNTPQGSVTAGNTYGAGSGNQPSVQP